MGPMDVCIFTWGPQNRRVHTGSAEAYGVIINVFNMGPMDMCIFTWGPQNRRVHTGSPETYRVVLGA